MRDNQKVYLGPYTAGARYVFMKQKKLRGESVANAEKLCYYFLSLANDETLTIVDADPEPYLSDNEVQYISLDEPIKTGVLALQNNQFKATQELSKEPVK